MKFKTVRQGEEAVIFNHLGEGRHVVGPARVFLFRERLVMLQHYSASPEEYLEIVNNDGLVAHKQGPCEMFRNPLLYEKISKHKSTIIDKNHMLVVYRRNKDNSVHRRVVQGPAVFTPQAEEWLHAFSWHGQDPSQQGRMVHDLSQFTLLPTVPSQFYYNVREVRTNDDTMVIVKLMIFYELVDVNKMLESTHDPIADMINAVCADVIAFVGKTNFQQFLQTSHLLNQLDTYQQLTSRCCSIGYQVTKVVYRGYHSSDQLQAMQDNAIQYRTKMRLEAEVEEQESRLANFKLHKEQARTQAVQDIEQLKLNYQQSVEKMKQEHNMALKQKRADLDLELAKVTHDAEMEISERKNAVASDYLSCLSELGVDLTKFLVAQEGVKVDERILVNTSPATS